MVQPNVFHPLKGTFRSLRSGLPRYSPVQNRCFGATSRVRAEDKSQSFKNQLYESTQQRLKRERAEQERYSQYQTQSQGGRYAALMFGTSLLQTGLDMDLISCQRWPFSPPVPIF
jgi:D-lactate dehydrogenase (cytochrome)